MAVKQSISLLNIKSSYRILDHKHLAEYRLHNTNGIFIHSVTEVSYIEFKLFNLTAFYKDLSPQVRTKKTSPWFKAFSFMKF